MVVIGSLKWSRDVFPVTRSLFLLFPDTSYNTVERSLDELCPRADFSFTRANIFVGKPFHYTPVVSAL